MVLEAAQREAALRAQLIGATNEIDALKKHIETSKAKL